MTLLELERTLDLRSEIKLLSTRMKKLQKKGDFVGDYGLAHHSGKAVPYTIQGFAVKDEPALQKLKDRLKIRVVELEKQISVAELFIESVPDITVRVLLLARFVDCMTWDEAAKMIYKRMSADSARMTVKKYFATLKRAKICTRK